METLRHEPGTDLRLFLPSQPEAIGTVRACVSEFVHGHGFADADDIVAAACQMCADAVLHAFRTSEDDGHFELTAHFECGCLRLDVTDDDADGVRALGVGLSLVERVAQDVCVSRPDDGGTRVRARFARGRTVTCQTGT
jgi:anti-sigma regulatory factor (Ser/Thr protein kinase)